MKTPHSSTRNHLLSHVRLPAAIPLMGAAAAMACVTLSAPGPVSAQLLRPSITPFPTQSPSPSPTPSPKSFTLRPPPSKLLSNPVGEHVSPTLRAFSIMHVYEVR